MLSCNRWNAVCDESRPHGVGLTENHKFRWLGRNSNDGGTVFPINSAPVASNVRVIGIPEVGELLTGNYTYSDVNSDREGTSTFKWYADDVLISGANSNTYTLTASEVGKTIKFEVTPIAQTGTIKGAAVKSTATAVVTP
ncbi:hypothetical protein [Brevibacillus centrosporus]